jgi:hypothetical protein
MTVLLIIYVIGLIINILMFSSVYSDLKDEGRMNGKTLALLLVMVLGSFVTWVGMIVYLVVVFIKNLRK